MKRLTTKELKSIKGGSSLGLAIGITTIVAFLVGVLSGITNPTPCGGEK